MRAETALAAVIAAMVAPSSAQGAWSQPLRPAGSGHASVTGLTVVMSDRGEVTTFFDAQPRLAQAPDGTGALTLNAGIDAAPGVAVAVA